MSVVTSLSDYASEFSGGLYVAAVDPHGRKVLALRKGDAVVHQYDLLHGVDVADEVSLEKDQSAPERYMRAAANQGFGEAMFQLGRTYLGKRDVHGAVELLTRAVAAGDVDAAFQLAQLTLLGLVPASDGQRSQGDLLMLFEAALASGGRANPATSIAMREAVGLFEVAAKAGTSVFRGAEFAQYNLGVAYLYGYGVERNPRLAAQWFAKCGLPEGMVALAVQANATGHEASARAWQNRATIMSFEDKSRKENRDFALFQLHSNWPDGPPRW